MEVAYEGLGSHAGGRSRTLAARGTGCDRAEQEGGANKSREKRER